MNIDHPNKRPADIQSPRDPLGDALLIGLSRQIYFKLARGPIRTFVTSILSFGIAPIIMWRWQFKRYVAFEQQQFWHLAKWASQNLGQAENRAELGESQDKIKTELAALAESARERTPHFEFRLLSYLCMAFLGIIFFTQLFEFKSHAFRALLDCTYLFPVRVFFRIPGTVVPFALAAKLFVIWNLCVGGAALCHLGKIYHHLRALNEFTTRFHSVAMLVLNPQTDAKHALVNIKLHRQLQWIVPGLILSCLGFIWLLPVMLAGAAHRRIMSALSFIYRSEIALQFREIRKKLSPLLDIKLPVYLRKWCSNEKCGAPLEEGENDCKLCQSRGIDPLYLRVKWKEQR